MVEQIRPYHSFLLLISLTLEVSGCATMADPPHRNAVDEAHRATQIAQEREQALTALRAEIALTRIASAKQEAELQALRATVSQLRQENSASQQALFKAKQTIEARQSELAALKTQCDQLAQTNIQSDVSERKLATLENTVTSLSQELTDLKQTLAAVAHKPIVNSAKLNSDMVGEVHKNKPSVNQTDSVSGSRGRSTERIMPAVHVLRENAGQLEPSWITVQPGESLWSLSRKYKTTIDALRAVNGKVGDHVKVGEELRLP